MISRAANILRLLGKATEGQSLGQIAKSVGLPRSTVQRIVSALAIEGLVTSDKSYHGVRLGPGIHSLARVSAENFRERWRPIMQEISEKTGETVDLALLDGNRMRFVDQIVGSHRLRTVSSIGTTFPLTSTANGKAALACLEHGKALELIKAEASQENQTEAHLTNTLAAIAEIRAGSLSSDLNEHTDGISALGFAVRDHNGDVYALSVPVPSSRFDRTRDQLKHVIEASRDAVSNRLKVMGNFQD